MSLPNTDSLMRKIQGYFKPYNEVQYEEVRKLLDRRLKSDLQREGLWNDIVNNYKNKAQYPPLVGDINKILDEVRSDTFNQAYTPAGGVGMSAAYIYTTIQETREKQLKGERVTNSETDFLATWGKVEFYWEMMVEAGKAPAQVCDCVRAMIERGESVPILNTDGVENIEPYILKALKNIVIARSDRRTA